MHAISSSILPSNPVSKSFLSALCSQNNYSEMEDASWKSRASRRRLNDGYARRLSEALYDVRLPPGPFRLLDLPLELVEPIMFYALPSSNGIELAHTAPRDAWRKKPGDGEG